MIDQRQAALGPPPGVLDSEVRLDGLAILVGLVEADQQAIGAVEEHVEEQAPDLGEPGSDRVQGCGPNDGGAGLVEGPDGDGDGERAYSPAAPAGAKSIAPSNDRATTQPPSSRQMSACGSPPGWVQTEPGGRSVIAPSTPCW